MLIHDAILGMLFFTFFGNDGGDESIQGEDR